MKNVHPKIYIPRPLCFRHTYIYQYIYDRNESREEEHYHALKDKVYEVGEKDH